MATDFTLPELGENIAGGDVVRLLVSPGDTITKDQPILELETDKATIEVPSNVSGTVKEVKIKQGERVKVGQVVLTLDNGAAPAAAKRAGPSKRPSRKPGRKTRRRPSREAAPAAEPEEESGTRAGDKKARRGRRHQSRREERTGGGTAERCRTAGPRGTGGAIRTPARARARRRDSPRCRQRPGRAHQRRRRSGVRAHGVGRRRRRSGQRAVVASRLQQVGRDRAQADEQYPAQDVGAPVARVECHSARHAERQSGHHRARSPAQAVRAAGREGRRQADDDGDCAQDRRRGAAQVPAVQFVD